ncbi:MAG: YraN family protein [Patescibacteria group bacterium]
MVSKTNKQKVGETGENVACRFLVKHRFKIIKRNYWKKWGEIDIIAEKGGILRFIEVKTVSCENLESVIHSVRDTSKQNQTQRPIISNGTGETDTYRPEDNVHLWKLKRLSRTIQTYLIEKGNDDTDWQFDVIVIYLDMANKKARVQFLEDIII